MKYRFTLHNIIELGKRGAWYLSIEDSDQLDAATVRGSMLWSRQWHLVTLTVI